MFTRRTWLRSCGAAILGTAVAGEIGADTIVPALTAVDHLLLGISDLDRGIAFVQQRTGVKPVVGGTHPGAGTRNALVSLAARHYLEIIAPDPAQTTYTRRFEVRTLTEPRLITWAAATSNIEGVARRARDAGYAAELRDGSRVRPDGKKLAWRTLDITNSFGKDGVEPIPFFIQWSASSPHPSQDSPAGCVLRALEIDYPDPAKIVALLRALGIQAVVKPATTVRLRARIATPKGIVELT
jgi:hypothetical protein